MLIRPPNGRERRALLDEGDGVPIVHTTGVQLPDVQIFHDFGSQLPYNSSGVTMLWQKPSVRLSPRLRGSLFYSEWEIIERDNVLVLCRYWYCKEERKEKTIGQSPC